MKRIISLFLVLVMLFSLTAIAFAQGIIPTPDVTTVKKGEQVKVTMTMEEKITGVTTAEFRLAYDENLFEFNFDSSTPGECDIAKSGDVGGQIWNGYVKYTYANTRPAGGTLDAGAVLATLVFTAKADVTAEQAATFTSRVYTFAKADGTHPVSDFSEKAVSVKVTPASTEPEGYAVAASAMNPSITVTEDAQVALKISKKDVTTYNAYYMEVSYDTAVLTYKGINTDASVTDNNGILKIADYGKDKTCGTDNIVLTFTGKATGEAKVTVTSAKVDVKANAAEKDAPAATIATDAATITVGGYQVTLHEAFTGEGTANHGQDYTFNAKDPSKKYDFTGSTMGGKDVEVIDNGNGTYTVKNVSGELVIKATEKAGKVTINLSGDAVDTITQKSWGTATEVDAGTALWFMAQPESGKELVVTVNGEVVAGMNMQAFMRYNITADKVTGTELNIVVNYKSSTDTITIIGSGDAWGDVDHDSSVGWEESGKVTDKTSAALKIKPAKDKTKDDYVVTINGKTQDLTQEGKGPRTRYMVAFVPADVAKDNIIKIDVSYKKAPEPTVTVDVREYLNLSGKTMFLITASCTDLAEGKVLAYNGNAMYWSEKYNAYAWLEIAADSLETVKAAATTDKFMVIDATDSNKISIAYNGDVNQTKSVDINDAQLVWNMYNAQYSDFNTVNIRKFLEADMNGDKTVSVLDATAIVDIITK
ncbi:MAG: hypothetical protein BHV93_07950 [Clostridiales bacterium 52_15]|nr:MAG: hypothetical protein BHV93_07950 [Clostridiales bacterium 52_15]